MEVGKLALKEGVELTAKTPAAFPTLASFKPSCCETPQNILEIYRLYHVLDPSTEVVLPSQFRRLNVWPEQRHRDLCLAYLG
jgi:hypothetical protein